jgi:glycerophosphoryl diester phosphodiesterase
LTIDHFILTAHRGGLFYRPENSLAAFEYSVAAGITWAECDIRLTKDHVPVIFHDDQVAFGHGPVKALREVTHRELSKIDIGGGETIPTLATLLERFGQLLHFDLELKELDVVDRVIGMVRHHHLSERVILSSFIPEALQTARDIAPEIKRGLLVDRLTSRLMGGKSAVKGGMMLGCSYFLPHYKALSKEWVDAAQGEGMKVIPWTVNRLDEGKALIDMGIDGLISDRPDQFFPILPNGPHPVSA